MRKTIDILMTLLLMVVMAYHYTGQMWHEITGTAMFALFIVHNVLNYRWYKSLFKGKYNAARVFLTVVNILLAVDILLLMLSGIAVSSYVFSFIPLSAAPVFAKSLHTFAGYFGFLLMTLHISWHVGTLFGKGKHRVRYSVLSAVLMLAAVLFVLFGISYIRRHFQPVNVDRAQATRTEKIDMKGKNGIIVYFTRVGNTAFDADVDAVSSASLMTDGANLIGNSELLSEMIANATGYPVHAIKTKNKYSSSYGDTVSEAGQEFRGERTVELVNDVPDLSEYDTVILVYPLWWWTLPMPVQKFLTENNLEGKTLYSLVTHGGSGFGSAIQDTAKYTAAKISPEALAVYDDEVTRALPKVISWLEKIANN